MRNIPPPSHSAPRFPVRVGSESKTVECFWAAPPAQAEIAALETWSSLKGSSQQIDAGELAQLAALKWQATCEWGTIVESSSEMDAAIGSNPLAEVTGMLLARADWFHGGVLGVCLFHRTWANNVFVDFLAVHPDTMKPDHPITGVGIGLLYQLCGVVHRLTAPTLWGETTAASVGYYQKLFDLAGRSDHLTVSAVQRAAFCENVLRRWQSADPS